jgi:hypothetical protein
LIEMKGTRARAVYRKKSKDSDKSFMKDIRG